mgnify:CR=1 FL=1
MRGALSAVLCRPTWRMKYSGPRVGSGPGTYGRGQHKYSKWFKYSQIIGPLLPIPVGCYLLYKAICSFNRRPPPIACDPAKVLSQPLYGEPVYQKVDFSPSTISRNLTPRER